MTTTSTDNSIEVLLSNSLSPNKETMTASLSTIEKLAKENYTAYLLSLSSILSSENKDTKIRQLSSILMKNSLLYSEAFQQQWKFQIPPQEKNQIKLLILSSLASNYREIRSGASTLIASICKIEQPVMTYWPELIPSLTQNVFNNQINLQLSAIETLGYVCEELTLKGIDTKNVDDILNALIQNLKNSNNNETIVQYIMKALFHCVHLADKNFSNPIEFKIIIESIFGIIEQFQDNDSVLDKIALFFIQLLSSSLNYDYIEPYFTKIIEFSLYLINKKKATNERLALLGLEIISTLGDEELSRECSGNNTSKKYLDKVSQQLLEIIIRLVQIPQEDENEWSLSKGCLYILSILVRVADQKGIKEFLSGLATQIITNSFDTNKKCKYWLLLSSCLNTLYRNDIYLLISKFLTKIINDINPNEKMEVQQCAGFLFMKITKYFPKILNQKKLESVITPLLICLNQTSPQVGINICNSLQNIIISLGDKETNKATNSISPCFVKLMKGLFIPALTELSNTNSDNNKLILSRLLTIDTLINYSSHDGQESVYQILLQFSKEIESTVENYQKLIASGINQEKIFQIQDYYYTLLRTIFRKYKTQISNDLGNKIWLLTDSIFKLRKSVFEEANLALASLALNMKNTFTPIFNLYLPYIDYSIKAFNISSLSKSGLLALLNCIRMIEKDVVPSSDSIIKTLIEVCTSNDVSRNNKTIAITCLGEIALTIGIDFSKYLKPVMDLLFSACQLGVEIKEDEDEVIIEFVKDLNYELIQTFTCIEFSLETNTELLVPYVLNIFTYFKAILQNKICQRADILKTMLSFLIDMVNIYKKEIKSLIDQQFASTLITSLKQYNIPAYVNEIAEQEEILNILFRN